MNSEFQCVIKQYHEYWLSSSLKLSRSFVHMSRFLDAINKFLRITTQ